MGLLQTHRRLRKRIGQHVVDQLFIRFSGLGMRLPMADPRRHGVDVDVDVQYLPTGSPHHRLDVYRPVDRAGPLPVVVYIHGGAFRALSKDTHRLMALAFARRGCLVYNLNYRLAPRHRFPAGISDVVEALRFVANDAPRRGGDLDRLVLAGESAGANLATTLALTLSYRRDEPFAQRAWETGLSPKAVVAACGVFHLTDMHRRFMHLHGDHWFWNDRFSELAEDYIPRDRDAAPGAAALADPLVVLEQAARPDRPLPAFFLPVGGGDYLRWDTMRMSAALSKLDVAHEAREYAGEMHAFHAFVFTPAARACWRDTFLFLERSGVTGIDLSTMPINPARRRAA